MQNKNWASTKSTKTNKNTTKNNTPKKPTKIMCCNFNDVAFFLWSFHTLMPKKSQKTATKDINKSYLYFIQKTKTFRK